MRNSWFKYIFIIFVIGIIVFAFAKIRGDEEIKRQEAIRKNLVYQIDLMRDAEELKNESRKKAEQKMGSIDFNDVDSAIAVLHDKN